MKVFKKLNLLKGEMLNEQEMRCVKGGYVIVGLLFKCENGGYSYVQTEDCHELVEEKLHEI